MEVVKKPRKPIRLCKRCKRRLNQVKGDGYFYCKKCFVEVNKLTTDADYE